ncbi:MAG: hypothetical protein CMO40_05755 [Verrucomicrobiaceae bacterium]|nr:hypothetical protein [Verrucomicrobiaceae bacterium]
MKGAATLATLVTAAFLAGILLVLLGPPNPSDEGQPVPPLGIEQVVEDTIGLRFTSAPEVHRVQKEVLRDRIEDSLTTQFGPGGLARRARALELLGFQEFGARSMKEGLIGLLSVGVRGWLNEKEGHLLVPSDFDESTIEDRVILHGLLARLLVHQHSPVIIGRPSDDERMARNGLRAALAESIKARMRDENRSAFELPTSLITEREALLSTLPIYLAAVGELPQEGGPARIYLETRVRTATRTLPSLIEDPPLTTYELLGGNAGIPGPVGLPAADPEEQSQLEESLGALQLRTLIEWLDSYEQAQALALLWRGDRYRLSANASGDHLLWVCRWETEAAAARAADILSRREERYGADSRAFSVTVHGKSTVLANCADPGTLQDLQRRSSGVLP